MPQAKADRHIMKEH